MAKRIYTSRSPEDRFWDYVDKNGPNGCWQWTGGKVRGYGVLALRTSAPKTKIPAHQFSYQLHRGELPRGFHRIVHHTCRNRSCVNPDHLAPMTRAEHPAIHAKERRAVAA